MPERYLTPTVKIVQPAQQAKLLLVVLVKTVLMLVKYQMLIDSVVRPACPAKLLLMASVKIVLMQEKFRELIDLAVMLAHLAK